MNDLSQIVKDTIKESIGKHSLDGEEVDFGFSFAPMADQNGQLAVVSVFVLRMKSLVIGEYLTNSFFISTPVPTSEQIDSFVSQAIMSLRQVRSKDSAPIDLKGLLPRV